MSRRGGLPQRGGYFALSMRDAFAPPVVPGMRGERDVVATTANCSAVHPGAPLDEPTLGISYFVEWDHSPKLAVGVAEKKIEKV